MKEIRKKLNKELDFDLDDKDNLPYQDFSWKQLYELGNHHLTNISAFDDFPIHIIDNIYLGSFIDRRFYEKQDEWIIVSMVGNERSLPIDHKGLSFPIDDFGFNVNYLTNFHSAITKLIELSSFDKKIYVHCASAGNRSVSAILGYITKKYKKSLPEAVDFFKHKRMINPCPKHLVNICLFAEIEIPIDFIIEFTSYYGWKEQYSIIRPIFKELTQENFEKFIYQTVDLLKESYL